MSNGGPPGRLASYMALAEPLLSFSSSDATAVDSHPLRGLVQHGPYTKNSLAAYTDAIRVAIVGHEGAWQGRKRVLQSVQVSQRPSDRREYVPPYPGFESLFGVPLVPADSAVQLAWPAGLDELGDGAPHERVRRAISQRMRQLAGMRDRFDVAVIHLPSTWGAGLRAERFDAHDEIKAVGAELNIPTQVLNDRTLEFPYIASLAWRLSIALYVKAGGMPWRLAPMAGVPAESAYIGLAYAFRGDPREARFVTCCSQVFDADGGGMQFVAYDARDPLEASDEARRNPYLSRSDMRAVLARSLALYRRRNGGGSPHRVVIHKTTAFTEEELAGASDALTAIREMECIEITGDVAWRGVWLQPGRDDNTKGRPDRYPVHRGTTIHLSGTAALVWVAGNAPSVAHRGDSYYQGGKSIPRPVLLTRHAGRGPLEQAAVEALALTKMDWNNDALYDPVPVTVGYSKRLARTIANVPTLPQDTYPYRMFM